MEDKNLDYFIDSFNVSDQIKKYMEKQFGMRREEGKYAYSVYYKNDECRIFLFDISHDKKMNYEEQVECFRKIFGGIRRDCVDCVYLIKTIFNVTILIGKAKKREGRCYYYHNLAYENTKNLSSFL